MYNAKEKPTNSFHKGKVEDDIPIFPDPKE
jgi:hypothetical protein